MKSHILVAVLMAFTLVGCSTPEQKGPASNQLIQSHANSVLTKDTLRMLKMFENAMRLNGEDVSPFGTPKIVEKKITQQPDAGGVWIEEWTVQRIRSRVAYTITFIPSRDGGTDISVKTPPRKL